MLALGDGDDHVRVPGPRPLGIEPGSLLRVIGVAVVVPDDVLAAGVRLALDPDVVSRVDPGRQVAVARVREDRDHHPLLDRLGRHGSPASPPD
jgi:hypothetical protein